MRRLLLAALAFLAFSGVVSAEEWIESPVTLTLTLFQTGQEQTKPDKNGTETASAPLEQSRFGNADILAALVAAELIPETKGWSLVVIWAGEGHNHPTASSYPFYARHGSGSSAQKVAVPGSILAFELSSEASSTRHQESESGDILSGSDKFEVYGRLSFETSALTGEVGGILAGTGRYRPLRSGEGSRYVTGAIKGVLQGVHHPLGSGGFGVAKGSITLGAAKFVDTTPPPPRNTGGHGYGTPGPTVDIGVDGGYSASVAVN